MAPNERMSGVPGGAKRPLVLRSMKGRRVHGRCLGRDAFTGSRSCGMAGHPSAPVARNNIELIDHVQVEATGG